MGTRELSAEVKCNQLAQCCIKCGCFVVSCGRHKPEHRFCHALCHSRHRILISTPIHWQKNFVKTTLAVKGLRLLMCAVRLHKWFAHSDDDFEGGHIKGCMRAPSSTFLDSVDQLLVPLRDCVFFFDLTNADKQVVFHCALSQQRYVSYHLD